MDIKIDLSNILEVMNPAFHWLLVNKSRNVVLRGGAGSSKSYSAIQALLFQILIDYDKPPVNYLLLRKTLPAAKKSIIPLLKHIMTEWGLTSDIVKENKSDHTFTFSNGSVIQVDSLDDPEKIKSIFNISKIMLEEANEFTLEDYLQLNRPEEIKHHTYSCDFGFTNPTALTRVAVQDNDIYVDELFYQSKKTNAQLIEFIQNNTSPDVIYCDSAEPNRIREMRNAGINAKKSKKEIKDGIDFVKRHHIYVTKRSNNIQTELNTYRWPDSKDGKNDKDVPIDFMNHACDAIRYGAYTKWGRKQSFGVIT